VLTRDDGNTRQVERGVLFSQGSNARFIVGGQIGVNYQIYHFVLGASQIKPVELKTGSGPIPPIQVLLARGAFDHIPFSSGSVP